MMTQHLNSVRRRRTEPYSLDLDIVFDAIGELAGEDGRDWVFCAPDSGADFLESGTTGGTPRRMGVHGSHLLG